MYRMDFRKGELELIYNDVRLNDIWEEFDDRLLTNKSGEKYKKEFSLRVGDKTVNGWAAVLEQGGRNDAGFSLIHSDRVVLGWPEAWRPFNIFGANNNGKPALVW